MSGWSGLQISYASSALVGIGEAVHPDTTFSNFVNYAEREEVGVIYARREEVYLLYRECKERRTILAL
jgi:hypothetical protein